MDRCTCPFPRSSDLLRITLQFAVLAALTSAAVYAQARPEKDPYQKISFKPAETCSIKAAGEVTYLIKNGVELSVTEDWDCDGVADAYDNCVAMPNTEQADSDGNGIGDVCEAAAKVKVGMLVKPTPKAKEVSRKTKTKDRRQRASIMDRRDKRADRKADTKRRKAVARR